jgi:hypothetical protein
VGCARPATSRYRSVGKREHLGQQREGKVERELVQEVHARETLERDKQARFGLGEYLVSMGDEKPVSRCSTRVLNRSKPSACTIIHALRAYEIKKNGLWSSRCAITVAGSSNSSTRLALVAPAAAVSQVERAVGAADRVRQ